MYQQQINQIDPALSVGPTVGISGEGKSWSELPTIETNGATAGWCHQATGRKRSPSIASAGISKVESIESRKTDTWDERNKLMNTHSNVMSNFNMNLGATFHACRMITRGCRPSLKRPARPLRIRWPWWRFRGWTTEGGGGTQGTQLLIGGCTPEFDVRANCINTMFCDGIPWYSKPLWTPTPELSPSSAYRDYACRGWHS